MYTFMAHTQYLAPKWRAYVTPYSHGFAFGNGVRVGSMWELKQALLTLDESLISPLVQTGSHHLADWILHEVGDKELADQLRNIDQRWGLVVGLERQMMRTLNLPDFVAGRWLRKTAAHFRFCDGKEVSSLEDLPGALASMTDETLRFHYERYPNDLSVWLSDVVGDYYLADSLEEAVSLEQARVVADDHLVMLRAVLE